ncbi:DEAD/DEAH box helicase [Paenibacillus turpanensis]|uniref:DEAD/DEAH box helicase n=1 Tax=Paenibacillus turpanensis TaxID=2689078 RepID=UPI00140A2366|nr:helicase-related protein [Paenibacillus turpanensis]
MKAVVYGVGNGKGAESSGSWRVSLHWASTVAFLVEKGVKEVVLLPAAVSFGQAVLLSEALEKHGRLGRAVQQLEQRGVPLPQAAREWKLRRVLLDRDMDRRYREGGVGIDAGGLSRFGVNVASGELSELVGGRSLLMEELMSFLSACGVELEIPVEVMLEKASLRGELRSLNGLELAEEKGRGWLFGLGGSKTKGWSFRCRRCGSGMDKLHFTWCPTCEAECPYCEACLTMGRVRLCSVLVEGTGTGMPSDEGESCSAQPLDSWGLSPAQEAAAKEGMCFLRQSWQGRSRKEDRRFLIWAVTGAGKTEMIFPLIDDELARGGRVLIGTPRRDVVIELMPRIKKAFPSRRVVTLYGGSEERWESGEITLATTHQLLRFSQAFDLGIIDEIDAFPYHGDAMLHHAVLRSLRPEGRMLLLTATPPPELRRQMRQGALAHVKVPVRYHRHPLPVPVWIGPEGISSMLKRGKLSRKLADRMRRSVDRGAQLFVFVPEIRVVEPVKRLLERNFPSVRIEGTASVDAERSAKVQAFRQKEIRILVTTTILERGVTVPMSDVYIFDAHSSLFDEAALVQMAGRAGRSAQDPAGYVVFVGADRTRGQRGAIQQICTMNKLAKKNGFLRGKEEQG